MNYQEFIAGKSAAAMPTGFDGPFNLPESLFPMQHDLVSWSLKRGRAAIFADTGLGKSRMQVSWAAKVHELPHAKLTTEIVRTMRIRNSMGVSCKRMAKQYGVHVNTVERAVNLTNWWHR